MLLLSDLIDLEYLITKIMSFINCKKNVIKIFIIFCLFDQIGRSSETPIDFVVMDTIPGDKSGDGKVMASTISRFACRILADRSNPRVARIYAAGFDSSRNIFLGVSCFQWWQKNVNLFINTIQCLLDLPISYSIFLHCSSLSIIMLIAKLLTLTLQMTFHTIIAYVVAQLSIWSNTLK